MSSPPPPLWTADAIRAENTAGTASPSGRRWRPAWLWAADTAGSSSAIPENVSSQVQDYIRGLGAALLILNRDRGAEEAFLSIRELNDGILAAIFLCEYMAREKIAMTDLARDVPGSGTAQANVSVPEGRSRAMGRLSAMPHFPSRRGIFFRDERGEVRIVPRSDAEQLRIFVSAHSTEAARELCDFYRNIIEK